MDLVFCPRSRDTVSNNALLAIRLGLTSMASCTSRARCFRAPCKPPRRGCRTVRSSGRDVQRLSDGLSALRQLDESLWPMLLELPIASGSVERAASSLKTWKDSLRKGVLPTAGSMSWPEEPFRSKLMGALYELEMPRFCRRHPQLLDSLLRQMLELSAEFEAQREEMNDDQYDGLEQQAKQPKSGKGEQGEERMDDAIASDEPIEGGVHKSDADTDEKSAKELQFHMELNQGESKDKDLLPDEQSQQSKDDKILSETAERMAEELIEQWAPITEKLDMASHMFDNIESLLEGPEGFDITTSVWRHSGWRELDSLRKKLENLKELRELVRSLGRGGGKGPLRKSTAERSVPRNPLGVVRSPLEPVETRSLTRSDDLSRMLPSEAALLAMGGKYGRLLHFSRRAERNLTSYERSGWVEDQSVLLNFREVRPSAECGPIIVCLDTSGSMIGARETVAKAVALECMRGAHLQRRKCYLYAFSGPGQVEEMELGVDTKNLLNLLDFLSNSFHGGTDVDEPLDRSLQRINDSQWQDADILMVTDGEIRPPSDELLERLTAVNEDRGVELHGLLVSSQINDVMKNICTKLHVFKSWKAVT